LRKSRVVVMTDQDVPVHPRHPDRRGSYSGKLGDP
jgi:hypothetical protein